MKHVKRIIIVLIILTIGISIINAKTDFFLNIGTYIPALEESFPQAANVISRASEGLASLTDRIPSFEEIKAMIKHEEPPIAPSDVAENAYIENSPMLTFYPEENISVIVDYNTVQLFGVTASKDKAHLVVNFVDDSGATLGQTSFAVDGSGMFNKTIDIPESDSYTLDLCVYTGSKEFGQFTSWVYNYVTLERLPGGGWNIEEPVVYRDNKQLYEKDKSVKDALKSTESVQSDDAEIKETADKIVRHADTDYEKVVALHDWVCENLYYDSDSLAEEGIPPYYALDVLHSKKAVCRGYATLMAALCRAEGIPCNVVTGYALGVSGDTKWTDENIATDEQNHAWNEVYVDGRWVIVDTTWDSGNKIENGMWTDGSVSHLYFDANLQFFSANHRIIEYYKR